MYPTKLKKTSFILRIKYFLLVDRLALRKSNQNEIRRIILLGYFVMYDNDTESLANLLRCIQVTEINNELDIHVDGVD